MVRNCSGLVETKKADFGIGLSRVVDVEGQAVLLAMKLASSKQWGKVVFESDSLQMVDGRARQSLDATFLYKWGSECLALLSKNLEWSILHAPRFLNESANIAARKASFEGWRWDNELAIPRIFGDVYKLEYRSCPGS